MVRTLTTADDDAYIEFLDSLGKSNPSILGYHYPFYRDLLLKCEIGEALYLGLWENNKLIGVIPGFIKRHQNGTVYSSMPFFGPNAGVICDFNFSENETIHRKLLEGLKDILQAEDNLLSYSVYTPFKSGNYKNYELAFEDALVIEKFTTYLNLNSLVISTKIAYDIRKALKSGISIIQDINAERISDVYEIYLKNCMDHGIPVKPFSAIEFLMNEVPRNDKVKTYMAYLENKMIGALIIIYGAGTVSYYLPCSIDEYRSYQAVTMLINEAFKDAKKSGLHYWNWESSPSTESGVYKFKKKWGSEDGTYRIYVNVNNEDKIRELGQEAIREAFPHFFVYPFNMLNPPI